MLHYRWDSLENLFLQSKSKPCDSRLFGVAFCVFNLHFSLNLSLVWVQKQLRQAWEKCWKTKVLSILKELLCQVVKYQDGKWSQGKENLNITENSLFFAEHRRKLIVNLEVFILLKPMTPPSIIISKEGWVKWSFVRLIEVLLGYVTMKYQESKNDSKVFFWKLTINVFWA